MAHRLITSSAAMAFSSRIVTLWVSVVAMMRFAHDVAQIEFTGFAQRLDARTHRTEWSHGFVVHLTRRNRDELAFGVAQRSETATEHATGVRYRSSC